MRTAGIISIIGLSILCKLWVRSFYQFTMDAMSEFYSRNMFLPKSRPFWRHRNASSRLPSLIILRHRLQHSTHSIITCNWIQSHSIWYPHRGPEPYSLCPTFYLCLKVTQLSEWRFWWFLFHIKQRIRAFVHQKEEINIPIEWVNDFHSGQSFRYATWLMSYKTCGQLTVGTVSLQD